MTRDEEQGQTTGLAGDGHAEPRFAPIEAAIEDIREGRIVIVVDDADRENEGDFIIAAEKVTPDAINFMATHGRGIVCLPCEGSRLDELRIPLMVTPKDGDARDRVHGLDRRAGHHHHGDQRLRPRRHDPVRVRPGHEARGPADARARLPAPGPGGRGPEACGAHRGRGRSGPVGRVAPRRRHLRDHAPRRDHGPPPGAVACGERAPPDDDLHRRPHLLSPPDREAGPQGGRSVDPDPPRPVQGPRVREPGRREGPRGHGPRRDRGRPADPGPGALGVPDRGRVPFAPLRLRDAARRGPGKDRRGGAGRRAVHPGPRGAGHRAHPQVAGLQAGRSPARTPSRRTSRWGSPPTPATTGSARRSSTRWAFEPCAC